jgi:hypothetical protein
VFATKKSPFLIILTKMCACVIKLAKSAFWMEMRVFMNEQK